MNADWAPLPLRIVLGIVFVAHGAQKLLVHGVGGTAGMLGGLGVPWPTLAAAVLIAVELGGGLALLLGLGTRVAASLLAIDMLVALLAVHAPHGFFLPRGIEFVLTLLGGTITLAGTGAGALSLDALWARADEQVVWEEPPVRDRIRKVS